MFQLDADGRPIHTDLIFSGPKKSGEAELAALLLPVTLLLFGGPNAEGYCAANDLEQAQSRVFERCRKIVTVTPLLKDEVKTTADKIVFTSTSATITALANDYASAAGAHPTLAVFDEAGGISTERARRMFDELVPVPTRSSVPV